MELLEFSVYKKLGVAEVTFLHLSDEGGNFLLTFVGQWY